MRAAVTIPEQKKKKGNAQLKVSQEFTSGDGEMGLHVLLGAGGHRFV